MANYGLAEIALRAVCPTNRLIRDNAGDGIEIPGAYVEIAAQPLSTLLTNGDGSIHPAFLINGVQKNSVFIGKFQGVANGSRIYSLAGEDPRANINLDTYERYCKNKGPGHHCITWAEWAYLALWCKKNNCQPYGNNFYGKDSRETEYLAIPSMARDNNGKIQRVATGTGPLTWSHNRQVDGIWDLNGNVWEWIAGIRLVKGELQFIPYNNAADPECDTSAGSGEWKAINANATSYNDLWLNPNGQGTTGNSVKLDYTGGHWQWAKSITSQEDNSRNEAFAATTSSGLNAFPKLFLQAAALLPEDGDTDYEGDTFYANNGADERCAYRGGQWNGGANFGVFALYFGDPRSNSNANVGGRPAFVELETA